MGEGGGNQVGAGLQTTEDSRQPSRWWEHREAVQPFQEPGGRVVVLGDFNLQKTDWTRGWSTCAGERMVVDTVGDMFWHQLVTEPTHRLGNTLDLCMTSSLELVAGVEVIAPLGSSDHNGLEVNVVGMAVERHNYNNYHDDPAIK